MLGVKVRRQLARLHRVCDPGGERFLQPPRGVCLGTAQYSIAVLA